ncbi:acyl-CoA thioesteras-like protein [Dothidotthia symphoricarpi CBS 119687]|uniref:Acyl-CoA thioesteras-like protein n=1 Tax=Dothidotthia symphoricarpi CBS 119687 TaxID=1392245 RepID=A0A6A6AE57_9PLEO|nr:acyl-CoA thioesteras-like protein [Dothidotthia symphoricarpi CBS 119687]KAF2129385.1 acyl-CoA thioesteras-like protein [Dothidotthia symphoricarpi CBS 119687]
MVVRPYFTEDKKVLPLDKILELEKIDDWTFRSIVKAYSPYGGENGTFGGYVFSQAAWAAALTVDEGYMIHNNTGFFILGGKPDEHFTYKVQKIRDGYGYCTRFVTVTQVEGAGDMFTCTCSFKREELSSIEVQEPINIKETYREVLQGKEDDPMQHRDVPDNDSENFNKVYLPAHPDHFNPVPGLHIRVPDMAKYNANRTATDRRHLHFYTLRGSLPLPTAPFPPAPGPNGKIALTRWANLHAIGHAYASDRNSLFCIPTHLDRPDFTRMASLSHTVIFHVGVKDLIMAAEPRIDHPNADPTLWEDGSLPMCNLEGHEKGDKDGRQWFVQEMWFSRATGGRALHCSRMMDYETGTHIATTFQDGLVRFAVPNTKL